MRHICVFLNALRRRRSRIWEQKQRYAWLYPGGGVEIRDEGAVEGRTEKSVNKEISDVKEETLRMDQQ